MSGVEWQEPPSDARVIGKRSGRLTDFAVELRANVGRWALVPDFGQERSEASAAGLAQNIRRAKVKGFERGVFEAAVLKADVWARCVDAAEEAELPPVAPPLARSSAAHRAARDDDPVPADGENEADDDAGDDDESDEPERSSGVDRLRTARLAADARAWAITQGVSIGDRGRVPQSIIDSYLKSRNGS